jgi:hypothetical protein
VQDWEFWPQLGAEAPTGTGLTRFLTDASGAKPSAVIPIQEHEALLEDLRDLAAVAERRDEPPISLDEVKRRLREANHDSVSS